MSADRWERVRDDLRSLLTLAYMVAINLSVSYAVYLIFAALRKYLDSGHC